MSDTAFTHVDDEASSRKRPRAFDTIVYGGLAVGILDALDAMIFFGLRGVSPTRIFQYITSALLGRASFNGGTATVLLGVLLHFVVAFSIASAYYGLCRILPMLLRQAVVWGILYGLGVYFVMNYVVLPLTAASQTSPPLPVLLNGLIGHALLIGLPVALIAQRSAKSN